MKAMVEQPLTYEEERGKPMPSLNHGAVQMNLGTEFAKSREFRVVSELTLEIGGKRLTPDLSIFRRQPLNLAHDTIRETEPPLLAVEIFSSQQGTHEVMEKLDVYFAHGVKSCWIVAPPLHHIEIHTPDGAVRRYTEGVATDPVLGVTADLATVFS